MARPRAIRPALTKAMIQEAEPGATRRYLWDGETPGLAVLVQPNGTKTFIVQRVIQGRTVRQRLGDFREMALAEARRLAEAPLGKIRAGRNPNEEKRAEKAEADRQRRERRERRERITCVKLWERYKAEVIAVKNSERTADEKARMWTSKIEPVIGKVAVKEVDADHVRTILDGTLKRDKKTGRVIAGTAEAGNLYRLLRHLFRTAAKWRLRAPGSIPTAEIEEPVAKRREMLLTDAQMGALFGAVDAAEADGEAWQVIGAIRFILMTGWRANEALTLKREHIYGDRSEARLPDTKTGFSVRPLAPDVLALLDGLKRVVGSPYCFPGIVDPRQPLSYSTVYDRFVLIKEAAGVKQAGLHVVRHRIVTDIAGASPNIRTGMAISGHKSTTAFLGYVHADRERAAAVAAQVTAGVAGLPRTKPEAKVVKLPKRRRRAG